jgi:hypothetical protein
MFSTGKKKNSQSPSTARINNVEKNYNEKRYFVKRKTNDCKNIGCKILLTLNGF